MKIIRRRQFLTRVALAVVAGIAEEDKYPAILNTLCTVRHASPLTVIAQCLMGVRPVEPGFKTFAIAPQYVFFKRAPIRLPSRRAWWLRPITSTTRARSRWT